MHVTILDPRYKDMPMDEDSHTTAKNLITDSMPDQTSVLSVPVTNENETKTEAAEVFPALPSLPPALTEPALEPKVEKLAKIEISADETDILAKKLKAEPECFLDDWFSDVIFVKEEKKPSTDRAAIIRDEIIRYMTTDPVSDKTDPLAWWELKQMLFPSQSCLAVVSVNPGNFSAK